MDKPPGVPQVATPSPEPVEVSSPDATRPLKVTSPSTTFTKNQRKKWNKLICQYALLTPEVTLDQVQLMKETIESGLRLNFTSIPEVKHIPNSQAIKDYKSVAKATIDSYIDLRKLELLPYTPDIVQPLHIIIKPGRDPRIVLDLSRNCNEYLHAPKFRYQSINLAMTKSFKNCWYNKLDIAKCFLSFPLHPDSQQFMCFEFEGQYYRFTHMIFGK